MPSICSTHRRYEIGCPLCHHGADDEIAKLRMVIINVLSHSNSVSNGNFYIRDTDNSRVALREMLDALDKGYLA